MSRKRSFGLGRQTLAGTAIMHVMAALLMVGSRGGGCSTGWGLTVNCWRKSGIVLATTVDILCHSRFEG